jgi:hypothetical protein
MSARRLSLMVVAWVCVLAGVFACVPAVASASTLGTGSASSVENRGATLNGTVTPTETVFSCEFEYGTSEGYGQSIPCAQTAAEINVAHAPVSVSARAGGLSPTTTYHFRPVVVTVGAVGTGSDAEFTTPVWPPLVEEESESNVGSSSARLSGQVDLGGSVTSYYFEYGTSTAYGSATPSASAGSGSENVSVIGQIRGLQPETVYHFRLVATNAQEEVTYGADATFKTFPVGVLGLPDGRGYEMVTPVMDEDSSVSKPELNAEASIGGLESGVGDKGNSSVGDETKLPFQAAADGSAIAYVGDPSVGGNGSVGLDEGNQYLARRSAAGGWSVAVIQPDGFKSPVYQAFSSDLSVGILNSSEPLSAGAPEDGYSTLYSSITSGSTYNPFFTITPKHRSLEGPEAFEAYEVPADGVAPHQIAYAGASSNMEHLLFEANDALTPLAEENVPTTTQNDLYDSIDGQLYLVDVLPDGKADANATFGAPSEATATNPDFSHVISSDGARVFWTDLNTNVLYVRENDTQPESPVSGGTCTVPADACTVAVSVGAASFWTASADGRYVFYTEGGVLYRFDVESEERVAFTSDTQATGDLSVGSSVITSVVTSTGSFRIGGTISGAGIPAGTTVAEITANTLVLSNPATVTATGSSLVGSPEVQGVVGASEDGSYVYFVADGELATGATSRACRQANSQYVRVEYERESERLEKEEKEGKKSPEEAKALLEALLGRVLGEKKEEGEGLLPAHVGCNLYVLHEGEPAKLIAVLSSEDGSNFQAGTTEGIFGDWTGALGRREAEVTPDGSHLAFVSVRSLTGYDSGYLREVFVYDADSGSLFCASCNPSGEPPTTSATAAVPLSWSNTYMPRFISEDGARVFFDSAEVLVPQATNGRLNVYEWEQDGSGSCQRTDGCIYLLSGGTSTSNSFFLDASTSGDDVFIATRAQLVPQDQNEAYNVFDVRVGASEPVAPPQCSGTGCQGVPGAQPIFATPPSVTFNGIGNFPSPPRTAPSKKATNKKIAKCPKGKKLKRGKCIKSKTMGRNKAKKAGNGRRAK